MAVDPCWQGPYADSDLFWDLYPLKRYSELYPKHPSVTGTFSSSPVVLHQLAHPPARPVCTPDDTDLSILKRHYPDADPSDPPWPDIEADLLAAGMDPANVKQLSSKQIVRLLDRIGLQRSSDSAPDSLESVPATHRNGGHPKGDPLTAECVSEKYFISPSTLSRRFKDGQLQSRIKVGNKYVYCHAEIAKLASEKSFQQELAERAPAPESPCKDE
jgi:hypothetical protein